MHPVWRVGAVGDHVDRVLAPRRLDPAEPLSLRRPDTASHVRQNLPLGKVLQDLLYHPNALLYLAYPDPVRGLDVARLIGDYVELHFWVPAVGVVPSNVETHPGAPQGGPGEAHLDGLLLRE